MKKRLICTVALALCGLLTCGAALGDGFTPSLNPDVEGQVKVVGNYNNFESLEAEFDAFNEYYPNVELTFTKLDDYNNTISIALQGGDAPDIYQSYDWMVGRDAYTQVFMSAENLADPALGIDMSNVRASVLYVDDAGQAPMATIFATSYGMLVNMDLFMQHGLSVPTTRQELKDVCAVLKEQGYASPIMGHISETSAATILALPPLVAGVANDSDAVQALNNMDSSAGEAMRPGLEFVAELVDAGCIDVAVCEEQIADNYNALILRFFEGDVPMMLCTGDVVSGTEKRESKSEAFTANPFTYRCYTVPCTSGGGYFVDMPNVLFSVNRHSKNLDLANEFMHFLMTEQELNNIASMKRLITASNDLTFDDTFAPFARVDDAHRVSLLAVGLMDDAVTQNRRAALAVMQGRMSVDQAIAAYGTLE